MIILATHVMYLKEGLVHGPALSIRDYLIGQKTPFVFITQALAGGRRTEVNYFNGKTMKVVEKNEGKNYGFISYILDILEIWKITNKYRDKNTIFIGVDVLNGFSGAWLKMFKRVKTFIYYSPDFALDRFKNIILDQIYKYFDLMAIKNADAVWGVSTRIVKYRLKQGVKVDNIQIPNSFPIRLLPKKDIKRQKDQLVIVASLVKDVNLSALFKSIELLIKDFPTMKLIVIGAGPEEEKWRSLAKEMMLEKSIIFYGQKPKSEAIPVLLSSGIGVAFYDNSDPRDFRYFADPMKVRDYMAAKLPIIISGNTAINEEISDLPCGIVVKLEVKDITVAIRKLLTDKEFYNMCSNNAWKVAQQKDIEKVLEISLSKYL